MGKNNPREKVLAKKKASKKKKVSKAKPELVKKKKTKKKKKKTKKEVKRETTKVKLARKKKVNKKKKVTGEYPYPPFQNKKTISTFAKHLLMKGRKSREIVAMVKKRFPDSKISGAHIPHYRASLRREGFDI